MPKTYYFEGHANVGAALRASLDAAGLVYVDAPAHADYVFTYFTSSNVQEERYFGGGGLMTSAQNGACLVDLSPSTPSLVREMSAVASVSDLIYVEAPLAVNDITLENAFAVRENLACCVAGETADRKAVVPVLKHFVGSVTEFSEPGAAVLAHAAWTLQHCASVLAAIEAKALYRALRYIPTSAAIVGADAVVPTAGNLEAAVVNAVAQNRFNGAYTTEMFAAELSAVLAAADDAELILPQAESCLRLVELLQVIGGSDKSPVALSILYDEEEAAAANGLDWSRAESYAQESSRAASDFDDAFSGSRRDDDDDDFGGYADLFGNYSDN